MPEALRPIVDWALQQKEIYRIWAFCDVDNRASARVLEKIGMQREGVLRRWFVHPNMGDVPRDCFCYARIKE
jgi:RimJ/RimL family protein N-acetyltransferase